MDTAGIIHTAMVKSAMRFNRKDINEWGDTKTYMAMAKDMAYDLEIAGYTLTIKEVNIKPLDIHLDDVTNLEGK
jgi:hypothetical protein